VYLLCDDRPTTAVCDSGDSAGTDTTGGTAVHGAATGFGAGPQLSRVLCSASAPADAHAPGLVFASPAFPTGDDSRRTVHVVSCPDCSTITRVYRHAGRSRIRCAAAACVRYRPDEFSKSEFCRSTAGRKHCKTTGRSQRAATVQKRGAFGAPAAIESDSVYAATAFKPVFDLSADARRRETAAV